MNRFSDNPYEAPVQAEFAQLPAATKKRGVGRIFVQFLLLELLCLLVWGCSLAVAAINQGQSGSVHLFAMACFLASVVGALAVLFVTLIRLLWATL